MARSSTKYPKELLKLLVNAVNENPGITKKELSPAVRPYHDVWYNPEKAKESDFGRYFNGALRMAGAHNGQREIRVFAKRDAEGRTVNAHAITSATNDDEILYAQVEAIEKQIFSLEEKKREILAKIAFKKKYNKTLATVVDGEIVERLSGE
ncbi:hypothetical protein [Sulfoacidibacillus thermotolerans]|uniref:Uncharacterized protein n=1 Tax=Sulfoacidibacillus thermotolerans TaxID=1765684 RepID=A0A2U3D0W5_SULT2|nr:hypothetical protein [Sulfoacidibacillus thermotolerans]PWI54875.1 hypothetical protein BM613_13595 [Sulfoacidibacillus thermotolerans]